MRTSLILAQMFVTICLVGVPPTTTGQSRVRTNPGSKCGKQSTGISNYYESVTDYIEPPGWKDYYLKISIDGGTKLDLATNGRESKLWTDVVEPSNIWKFMLDLNEACKLPPDPAEVAALLKVRWDTVTIPPAQFARIHKDFVQAFSQYTLTVQQRYEKMVRPPFYLHMQTYRVIYDNGYERVDMVVRNDPKEYGPMLDWIQEVQQLFQEQFHRPFATQ